MTAGGAALLFGGWAAFANRDHPVAAIAGATAAQACLSAASTFAAVLLLELLFGLGRTPLVRFLAGALATPLCILLVMAGVHWAVGTPRILVTIAPSIASGTLFCTVYTLGLLASLRRRARGEAQAP